MAWVGLAIDAICFIMEKRHGVVLTFRCYTHLVVNNKYIVPLVVILSQRQQAYANSPSLEESYSARSKPSFYLPILPILTSFLLYLKNLISITSSKIFLLFSYSRSCFRP